MDATKRRAFIKQQAAKKKYQESQLPKGTSSSDSSTKRKLLEKQDHLPKKPKITLKLVMGLKARVRRRLPPLGREGVKA